MSTTEELLDIKSSGYGLENRDYGSRHPPRWSRDTPLFAKVGTNFGDKQRSLCRLADSSHWVRLFMIIWTWETHYFTTFLHHHLCNGSATLLSVRISQVQISAMRMTTTICDFLKLLQVNTWVVKTGQACLILHNFSTILRNHPMIWS
jgi:hypothetical protein